MQRQRYLIIQDRPRLNGVVVFVYVVMFILASAYFFGFFYWGTQELESEIQIEVR